MSDLAHGRRSTALPQTSKGKAAWDLLSQAYTARPRRVAGLVERLRALARLPERGSLADRECADALRQLEALASLPSGARPDRR